jgi:hypothetical protein
MTMDAPVLNLSITARSMIFDLVRNREQNEWLTCQISGVYAEFLIIHSKVDGILDTVRPKE